MVGPEGVGNTGCCRIGFAGFGVWTVGGVGRPDCSTSSFCFVLSWTTKLSEVVWMNLTTLEYSSDSLSVLPVSAKFQQKFWETDLGERELVTGTF